MIKLELMVTAHIDGVDNPRDRVEVATVEIEYDVIPGSSSKKLMLTPRQSIKDALLTALLCDAEDDASLETAVRAKRAESRVEKAEARAIRAEKLLKALREDVDVDYEKCRKNGPGSAHATRVLEGIRHQDAKRVAQELDRISEQKEKP